MFNKGDCVVVQTPGKRKRKAVVSSVSKRPFSMLTVMYLDNSFAAIKPEWIIEKIMEE